MTNQQKPGDRDRMNQDQKNRSHELPKDQHENTRRQQESGQFGDHGKQQGGGQGNGRQQQGGQGGSRQHQQDHGNRPNDQQNRAGRAAMTDVDSDTDKQDRSDEDRDQGRKSVERD